MQDQSYLSVILPGITFGFAAAAQPGPLSVFLISRTLQSGWRKALPAVFSPLITDGPIAVLCLLILGNLPFGFLYYIRIAGGFFILYLAFSAGRTWKQGSDDMAIRDTSAGRTLFDATLVNFLNPGPYLGWSLIMGPMLITAWNVSVLASLLLVSSFYLTMFSISILTILVFSFAKEKGERIRHVLLGLSVLALAGFGIYQLLKGILLLTTA